MGSRLYQCSKVKKTESRKKRKEDWIERKNLMRQYPECAYNGDFYCNQSHYNDRPWHSVDFTFFHSTKKRYFTVSMITADYEILENIEVECDDELDKSMPYPEGDAFRITGSEMHPTEGLMHRLEPVADWLAVHDARKPILEAMIKEKASQPRKTKARIDVNCRGRTSSSLWVVLDKPFIDENVIREFISHFRSIGEPIETGRAWEGKEIEAHATRALN